MKVSLEPYTFSEFGDPVSNTELIQFITKKNFLKLIEINRCFKNKIFQFGYDHVHAKNYVGYIKVGDAEIQIIPKICRGTRDENLNFLLCMLQYTKRLNLTFTGTRGYHTHLHGNFFEFLVHFFAKSLDELLKRDYKREYMLKREILPIIRGKINLNHQFFQDIIDPSKFHCSHYTYSRDTPLNRILYYCTYLLYNSTNSHENKRMLGSIMRAFFPVKLIPCNTVDVDKIIITRLNANYKQIILLCKLLLSSSSIGYSNGELETFTFLFDMNRLFEEFIYQFIKKNESRILIGNRYPITKIHPFQRKIGNIFQSYHLIPDILLYFNNNRRLLIDVKYKIPNQEGNALGRVSKADLYQMFAYSQFGREKIENILLLYPKTSTHSLDRNLIHELGNNDSIKLYSKGIDFKDYYDDTRNSIDSRRLINKFNEILDII